MDVFTAIADPTRRRIIDLLAGGERDAGTIADLFPVSQPAISRHLRVLREARLVEVSPAGTRRVYRLHPTGLKQLEEWVDKYQEFWEHKIDALAEKSEEETP